MPGNQIPAFSILRTKILRSLKRSPAVPSTHCWLRQVENSTATTSMGLWLQRFRLLAIFDSEESRNSCADKGEPLTVFRDIRYRTTRFAPFVASVPWPYAKWKIVWRYVGWRGSTDNLITLTLSEWKSHELLNSTGFRESISRFWLFTIGEYISDM